MNKSLIALMISGLFAVNAHAAGQDDTWYGGAKLGWSDFYGVDEDDSVELGDESSDDFGAGAFVGYQFNENFGIELGYDWLGEFSYDGTRTLPSGAVPLDDDITSQLVQLTLKLGWPVTESLDLYGRLGGGYAFTDSDVGGSDDNGAFVGALGAEYAFNRDWAGRFEYQYTTPLAGDDDVGVELDNGFLSLGVVYRFGQAAPMVAAVEPAPAPEPVIVDKQFNLSSDVLFDFNKATLKPEAHQALDTLYSDIEAARPKDGTATVIGHTDRLGSDAYNQSLSEQRAQTVADYLVGKGLPAGKVTVEGRGESSPVTGDSCSSGSKNELIVCLAPDRRVEVRVQGTSEVQQ